MTCDDLDFRGGVCRGGTFYEPRCSRCQEYRRTGVPAGLDINRTLFARYLREKGRLNEWPDGEPPQGGLLAAIYGSEYRAGRFLPPPERKP